MADSFIDLALFRAGDLLETEERFSKYRLGGYHPVCLGDTFKNGRYKIHHKIGFGAYSTVWLAKDVERNVWVSIKISTADSADPHREVSVFRSLAQKAKRGLCSNYIVELLDNFIHQGPNGEHQCLVFELLGPSVSSVLQDYTDSRDRLDPDIIFKLSKQSLVAIAFVHEAGFAHGDISLSNMAFTSSRLSRYSKTELFEAIGAPEWEEVKRVDGKPLDKGLPRQLVKKVEWTNWIDEDEEDIRIFDLGEAFVQGKEHKKLAQPGHLQVPETIFTDSFDYRVDLWRAGAVIYALIFHRPPFYYMGKDDPLASQMIGFVQKLPGEWHQKYRDICSRAGHARKDSIENGNGQVLSLRERFQNARFEEESHQAILRPLISVIEGLMRFKPLDRISSTEALEMITST